jgi:hypothetical protein
MEGAPAGQGAAGVMGVPAGRVALPMAEWVAYVHRLRDLANDDPTGPAICARCRT